MDQGFKAAGVSLNPTHFSAEKRRLQYKVTYTGALDNEKWDRMPEETLFVENAIAALEAGKAIEAPSTKAIGCEVKR